MADIDVAFEDGLALVTLNRPERRNALALAMWRRLPELFAELGENEQVRAIALTGAAGNFSAGADISEFAKVRADADQARDYEVAVDRCCDGIFANPKPTIAVVRGSCMGGACNIAMSCDFRFAARDARFGIPAARLSIVYGVRGTQKLLALVGVSNAKRILYSGSSFDAAEGLRIGFFDRLDDDPLEAARDFATTLARNAPLTISGSKALLNAMASGTGELDPKVARAVIEGAMASEDYREGRTAFTEKRAPVFKGR